MAIAPVSSGVNSYTWNTALTTTLTFVPWDLVAGLAVVIGVVLADDTKHVVSIADTKGNLYSFRYAASTTGVRTELWECQSTLAQTSNTITITLSGASLATAIYQMYSGVYSEPSLVTQDAAYGTTFSTQISCGVVTSNIASWGVGVFGWINGQPDALYYSKQGTIRQQIVPNNVTIGAGVAAVIVDVHGYPIAGNPVPGYGIDPPIGHLGWKGASITELEPQRAAEVVLELRSPSGLTPGSGTGGTVPQHPPFHPDPPGSRLPWSYTFVVADSGPLTGPAPDAAQVTCKYVGAGCSAPNNEFGNVAY
jgi:hypothetical protein